MDYILNKAILQGDVIHLAYLILLDTLCLSVLMPLILLLNSVSK
ncbi:hypothetical protein XIS1_190002 [Xenorhabdus innexi]|uniref:Uncharacterized protein n=1 Tax=Xenorhabdus innexi TaxID=290109 RepID=A0A1N6MWW4_9GAMM|nr:hypothetical protein XIS1_190002 [Xenorhabdus innexi]